MGDLVRKAPQDKLREKVRIGLEDLFDEFMLKLKELKPKDYVDAYIKLLPYIMSRMPEEKAISESDKAQLILEETTRKATLIQGGLPTTEDTDYEEEANA